MTDIRPFPTRATEGGGRKFETFSYLPVMKKEQVREQVAYLLRRGFTPSIEYTEPAQATNDYWYLWKLPLFGDVGVEAVMDEVKACHKANPGHYIRLVGIDRKRQTQGLAIVVYRGEED